MTRPHSPWPLFTADLELARAWLQPQLEGPSPDLRCGHTALSLGMVDAVQALLAQPSRLPPAAAAQWGFRLARLEGQRNPYATLVPRELQQAAGHAVRASQTSGQPLAVSLNGGIGDHLEALSLLLPWARQHGIALELHTSGERQQQLTPLLGAAAGLQWSDRPGLAVMALRSSLLASPILPPTAAGFGLIASTNPPPPAAFSAAGGPWGPAIGYRPTAARCRSSWWRPTTSASAARPPTCRSSTSATGSPGKPRG